MRMLPFLLVAGVLAGCGGAASASVEPEGSSVKKPQAQTTVPSGKRSSAKRKPACVAGMKRPVGTNRVRYAAVVRNRASAYRSAGAGRLATFGSRNQNGVPMVFAVLSERVDKRCVARWYRVRLPMKPNGIVGWVRARDVLLAPVTTRIEVDLSARRVTLFDRGRRVLTATAAIGSPRTPTPTGRYYINQRLIPRDTSGPFGPGALGISAFSEVLTGWAQGGPIAIHGTNRPELLGGAVSNGCIRVRNDQLRRLFKRARAGTPVTVRA